jgi:peroxiredoxin
MSSILAAGTVAPNFTLRVTPDQNLTLSDLRGKPVILAFYRLTGARSVAIR